MQYAVTVTGIDPANRIANLEVNLEGGVLVPDLTDLDLKDALQAVKAVGLGLRSHGVGVVVSQNPAAGVPVPIGSVVTVVLSKVL
jgi:beta-lactam-binding protein with PASTA domain